MLLRLSYSMCSSISFTRKANESLRHDRKDEEAIRTYATVLDMYNVCKSTKSFTEKLSKDLWMTELVRTLFERADELDEYSNFTKTLTEVI